MKILRQVCEGRSNLAGDCNIGTTTDGLEKLVLQKKNVICNKTTISTLTYI
jgi:hypothetical protein